MDPVTATQNAITAFFNFAATPVGQQIIGDIRNADQKFFSKIGDLFNHMHAQATAQDSKPEVKS